MRCPSPTGITSMASIGVRLHQGPGWLELLRRPITAGCSGPSHNRAAVTPIDGRTLPPNVQEEKRRIVVQVGAPGEAIAATVGVSRGIVMTW